MNFLEAVRLAVRGKKVRRKNWSNDGYIHVVWDSLRTHKNSAFNPWIESILANDWEVAQEAE